MGIITEVWPLEVVVAKERGGMEMAVITRKSGMARALPKRKERRGMTAR
jgi:hypothetical protein